MWQAVQERWRPRPTHLVCTERGAEASPQRGCDGDADARLGKPQSPYAGQGIEERE